MIWEDVELRYGKKLTDKMKKSQYLQGITVKKLPNGEIDIPERDIDLAYRDVKKKPISITEWD